MSNTVINLSFKTEGHYSSEEITELADSLQKTVTEFDDDAIEGSFTLTRESEDEVKELKMKLLREALAETGIAVSVSLISPEGETLRTNDFGTDEVE